MAIESETGLRLAVRVASWRPMLDCPSCGASIGQTDVRWDQKLAICSNCDLRVQIAYVDDEWVALSSNEPEPPKGLRVEVDEPPEAVVGGYREMAQPQGRLTVTRRWWTPGIVLPTVFVLLWDAFFARVYGPMVFGSGTTNDPAVYVGVPHAVAGVVFTWFVLAIWLNRTTIDLRERTLSCHEGPIRWPFNRPVSVSLDSVESFELAPKDRKGRQVSEWRVLARLGNGETVPVVTRLVSEAQAKFLVRRLEQYRGS